MGWIACPPAAATAGGTLTIEGDLDVGEVRGISQKLTGVLQLLHQASSSDGVGANGVGVAAVNGAGARAAPADLAARLAALKLRVAGAPPAAAADLERQQPSQSLAPASSAPAAAVAAAVLASPPLPPSLAQQQYDAPPPPPRISAYAPTAAAPRPPLTAAPAAPPAPPQPAPGWRQCFATDADDHSGRPVAALAYVPRISGLPSGDGHLGWLISSARGVVNLFECNAGGGSKGVPSLMLMHSQEVDLACARLAVEASVGLMFAASVATDAAAQECVSVHSLDVERLLAYRYRFAPPGQQARPPSGTANRGPRLVTQVASVHALGGVLSRCCVASYGSRLVLFEAPSPEPPANTTITSTRNSWDAHPGATAITALHLSPAAPTLWSGANDGGICSWDLRARPSAPATTLRGHARNVTGLASVGGAGALASCGIDGQVLLWDPRRPAAPLAAVAPDGAPCLRVAAGPFGDCLAVSTNRGLHAVDIDGAGALGAVAPVAPFPLQRPFADVAWNVGTGELYASGAAGTISVFTR